MLIMQICIFDCVNKAIIHSVRKNTDKVKVFSIIRKQTYCDCMAFEHVMFYKLYAVRLSKGHKLRYFEWTKLNL